MTNLIFDWDDYNKIGTVFNAVYVNGVQFVGDKPDLNFKYNCLFFGDDKLDKNNYFHDVKDKKRPFSHEQEVEVRTFAAFFSLDNHTARPV